jgi:hypothetical protein
MSHVPPLRRIRLKGGAPAFLDGAKASPRISNSRDRIYFLRPNPTSLLLRLSTNTVA